MKKTYVTPEAEKVQFCYNQQVVASGSCHWENNGYWTHSTPTCRGNYNEGTAVQVPA